MAAGVVIRARIDPEVKSAATDVLAAVGLTASDAFRMLMTRIAHDKALPFELLTPNATTEAALCEAQGGGLPRFDDTEALMGHLSDDE